MKEGFFSPEEPVFPVGLNESLLQHFLDIIYLVDGEPPGYQLQAGAAVVQIMATILAILRQNRQSTEAEQIVQKTKFIFEENKYSSIAMETVAESVGLPYPLFRRVFKDYTGLPPHQYFLQMKINKAKTLLREQRYTVKEIAHMLAFENQYYFSRLFKRKTGIAPSMWQSERAIS
jgi:AraC-like DNA-binding protein